MHLTIIIQDIDKKEPAEPHITAIKELRMETAIILEKGTSSGDTSIAFRAVDDMNKSYLIQMTGNAFRMLAGAFQGAHERFTSKRIQHHEGRKCVNCKSQIEQHTTVAGPIKPKEGDFNVCVFCGQLYRLNKELESYPVTPEQEKELWQTHRNEMQVITQIRLEIKNKRGAN